MANVIDQLVVMLGMDNKGFIKGAGQASAELNRFSGLIKGLSAVGMGMFLKNTISDFIDSATAIKQFSDALGVNATEVQAWGEAVKRQGGTAEGFQSSLKTMTENLKMIPLQGGSPVMTWLNRLGINFRDAQGNVKQTTDVFKELSAKFETMDASQSLSLGKKLGIDEGTIRLLQQGSKGVDELVGRMKNLGVYSTKDLATADRLKKTFLDFGQSFKIAGLRIAEFILPAIETVVSALTKMSSWVQDNQRLISSTIMVVSGALTAKMIPAILATGKALLLTPAGWITLAIAGIGLAITALIDDFKAWKEGAESFFNWQPFLDTLSAVGDKIAWLMDKLSGAKDFAKGFIGGVVDFGGKAGDFISSGVQRITGNSTSNQTSNSQSVKIENVNVTTSSGDAGGIAKSFMNEIGSNNLVNNFDRSFL